MKTVLLETDDLGEAEAVVGASYARMRFDAKKGDRTRTRMVRSTLGPLAFDELDYGYTFDYVVQPMEGCVLVRTRSGLLRHRHPGCEEETSGPGAVLATGWREGVPLNGTIQHGHFDTLLMPRRALDAVAAPPPAAGTPKRVHLTGGTPVSPAAGKHMVTALDYVVRDVIPNPAARGPLLIGSVIRFLAASMLSTFPNTALVEPTIEDRRDSTPALLRRAMAYVDDNAHRDISPADIAVAVHVSPRALQYMFRKHRGLTPREYLRQVRLHHAHRDLVGGTPENTTVGRVAARWGFGHRGRFAQYYRQAYGVSPLETLTR